MRFATGRLDYILDTENKGKAWLAVDEVGDDPDEPIMPVTLTKLPRVDE